MFKRLKIKLTRIIILIGIPQSFPYSSKEKDVDDVFGSDILLLHTVDN